MFGNPAIGLRELAQFCRRLSVALEAGVDLRKALAREAGGRASRAASERFETLRLETNRGRAFSDAVERTGDFFPPLFREMVQVGEETGKLPEVLRHLAEHYELQLQLRRSFLSSITWPLMQLTAAILIVGFVIWILGIIGSVTGQTIDILGFGLIGNRGVAIYFTLVGLVVLGAAVVIRAAAQGRLWVRPVQLAAVRLPVLGPALRTLALSRLAWALHLTLDAGMDLRRAVPLSLRSSRDPRLADTSERVVYDIGRGREITEAMADTGAFPRDFLDAVEVGERSGRLPEQLGLLSAQYQDQARGALSTLTTAAGFGVWMLVAALIILLIFRLFNFYLGTINEALQGI
jgi:type II secretory pathway component PulF